MREYPQLLKHPISIKTTIKCGETHTKIDRLAAERDELTCRAKLRIFYYSSVWRLREISIRPNQNRYKNNINVEWFF